MTDKHPSPVSSSLTDEDLQRAVRYLLQLAIEWNTDGAAYEGGAALLKRVVTLLDNHRTRRQALKRRADVVELVEPIMDRFRGERANLFTRQDTGETVSKWLGRRGIIMGPEDAERMLGRGVRAGAKKRTEKERLLAQLAEVAGTSQSELEKLLAVIEHGKQKNGRLGNELLHERAVRDRPPSTTEMVLYAIHALGVDEATGQAIGELMPLSQLEGDLDDRNDAAAIFNEGSRVASGRARAKLSDDGKGATAAQPAPTKSTARLTRGVSAKTNVTTKASVATKATVTASQAKKHTASRTKSLRK